MIYLAAPYSHKLSSIREQRYDMITAVFAALCKKGFIVYSPITMCHVAAVRHGLPTDHAFWERMNFAFLSACEEVRVLTLEGWETSRGVKAELDLARELHKPIIEINYEDFDI